MLRILLSIGGLGPAVYLIHGLSTGNLGFNPFGTLVSITGQAGIWFLIATLAITPLRRWLVSLCRWCRLQQGRRGADWNFLIRIRRMLGLYGFFYVTLHAGVYCQLEMGWRVDLLWQDATEKRYLWLGWLGWLMLIPLAVTSHMALRRRMGKNWRRLHRVFYIIAVVAVLHILESAKVGDRDPVLYAAATLLLLGHRLTVAALSKLRRPEDEELEIHR